MPFPDQSPYDLLGVGPQASPDEITSAYRRALKERADSPQRLTYAYNELRNPRRRLEWDLLAYAEPTCGDEIVRAFDSLDAEPLAGEVDERLPVSCLVHLDRDTVVADWVDPPLARPVFHTSDRFGVSADVLPPLEPPL